MTPGPWNVCFGRGAYLAIERREIGETAVRIASVANSSPNAESDALLIAAAPDLLEAVRACLLMCEMPPAIKTLATNAMERAGGSL